MEKSFIIRSATLADTAELLEIYTYYVTHTAATFEYEPPTAEEFEGRISGALKKYPYLCIECDGQIAGFAFAHAFRERPAYDYAVEVTIYLRHDMRHQGLGKAIYLALEEELRKMGIRNLYACIALPDGEDEHLSDDSPRFHEALGYRLCGTFRNCGYKYGSWYTMVWMEKIVNDFCEDPDPVIPYPELQDRAY